MNAVLVHSGRHFSLSEPRAEDVALSDIARSLSRLARFTGHTIGGVLSVAQHSVLVKELVRLQVPDSVYYLPFALMHDAHEAYTGDINTPMAREIVRTFTEETGFEYTSPIKEIKNRIQAAIHERFTLLWPMGAGVTHVIKVADEAARILERDRFMPANPDSRLKWECGDDARQLANRATKPVLSLLTFCWSEEEAMRLFLENADALGIR